MAIDEVSEVPHSFSDNPEFEDNVEKLMTNLFEMNGHLNTLQQFVSALRRNKEEGNVKSKMVANIDKKAVFHINEITKLIKALNASVHIVSAIEESALNKAQLLSRDKLIRDVKYSIQEFQEAQREFTSTSKAMNEQARAALAQEEEEARSAIDGDPKQALATNDQNSQPQQVVIEREAINNEEFAYQQNLIQDRDREISHIESGIIELNEIFHDLGTIVQQQGHLVDNIESNIYSVANSAQSGARELRKAMNYQRGSSRSCLVMLGVLIILLLMFILVVF
ncbi:LADA_0A02366g1_1 [Lachancea dasiensis]|uniref:LADA_0A02366g1_1 n=1 Tax=Lachancea dasiensis TaxID=1072105 RepID=A0A1G4IMJ2_9SACH|nr:LADA_0A02366g1_1 [Lachancea dasiensis]